MQAGSSDAAVDAVCVAVAPTDPSNCKGKSRPSTMRRIRPMRVLTRSSRLTINPEPPHPDGWPRRGRGAERAAVVEIEDDLVRGGRHRGELLRDDASLQKHADQPCYRRAIVDDG